jgi:hypothetical protein
MFLVWTPPPSGVVVRSMAFDLRFRGDENSSNSAHIVEGRPSGPRGLSSRENATQTTNPASRVGCRYSNPSLQEVSAGRSPLDF